MRVWKDIISNDEMVTDSYPFAEVFGGAGLEVKASFITKIGEEDHEANTGEVADERNSNDTPFIDVVVGMRL